MSTQMRDELWNSVDDEPVEVNQRALIDKVLARYSGEFTVFRELLQNSDDAASKAVQIHFETQSYLDKKNGQITGDTIPEKLPNLKTAQVHQWTFKNNGILFRDEDWNRLKKIAEGNPDEEKIGAFGVGFYSLFSVTDDPFVTSGGQWMGFYWKDKKDQLFARRGSLPDATDDVWTTFEMKLREPAPIPAAFDFTRFLVSSITFMIHLSEVSVYFDDKQLVRLSKDTGIPKQVAIPRGLNISSAQGLMKVTGIKVRSLYIKAQVMNWVYSVGTEKPQPAVLEQLKQRNGFFASLLSSFNTPQRTPSPLPPPRLEDRDLLSINDSSVVLSVFTAEVDVQLTRKVVSELLRSTKKNPPSKLKYELIYTGKDDYDTSKKEDEVQAKSAGSVFQGLRADLEGEGLARVFIGHATAQTTGIGGHMSARFIPTVERESIDLVDRNVAVWNKELLSIGGFLARAAYEIEMSTIQNIWNSADNHETREIDIDSESGLWLRNRSLHTLQFFTFNGSTPSPIVSSDMKSAFFRCSPAGRPLPIISSTGIHDAWIVRMPDSALSGFIKNLPLFPEDLVPKAQIMIALLREKGMLKDISFMDVLQELRSRPLSDQEVIFCLKWWIDVSKQGGLSDLPRLQTELLNAAVIATNFAGTTEERIIPLSTIQTVLNPRNRVIPIEGPLPDTLLPVSIGRSFDADALLTVFPWRELTIVDWVRHITDPAVCSKCSEFDLNTSPPWAEKILQVLSRAWPNLSRTMITDVVSLLKNKSCISTSAGMKVPEESYFSSADIFHDLPVVTLSTNTPIKAPLSKVLEALGVRKHVELQLIFHRLIKTGDWTIADLVKYLVSVQSTLMPMEIDRLRMTAAFPKERRDIDINPDQPSRHRASDLYEPLEIFRELGLPVIDWGIQLKWKGTSEEANFLYRLGLQRFPPLGVILNLIANSPAKKQAFALNYFLDNYTQRYSDYDPSNFPKLAYIPAVAGSVRKLVSPDEVFASAKWALLGFTILDPDLRADATTKLKIGSHPPASLLLSILENSPPKTEALARQWFGVLASHISDFSPTELSKLSNLAIVPVAGSAQAKSSEYRLLPPIQCYFKGDSNAQFHSRLFVFVDFGPLANSFLSACGTKREPSVEDVVQILLANPRKFYELADGRENFLVELRNMAVNLRLIQGSTIYVMKKAPILLASRRVKKSQIRQSTDSPDADEDDWDFEYDMLTPSEIIIADDTNAFQLFGDSIFSAPQEDLLEEFYLYLGSQRLSALVKEEYTSKGEIKGHRISFDTRALILERMPLFLHEHTHTRTRVSYSWLNDEKNFVVRVFGSLAVVKSLSFGSLRTSKTQDASAVARRDGRGPIQLWLAANTKVDMYEVATSLCRLLFETHKVNDALLFMTILSTDLKALRRRGYNVDKILRQQKQDHEAAEKTARSQTGKSLPGSFPSLGPLSSTPSPAPSPQPQLQHSSPASSPVGGSGSSTGMLNASEDGKLKSGSPLSPTDDDKQHPASLPCQPLLSDDYSPSEADMPPRKTGFLGRLPRILNPMSKVLPTKPPTTDVTTLSNIESNIDSAVKACREETGHVLDRRMHADLVKESLSNGYCDISGRMSDLKMIGKLRDIKLYASEDACELMKAKEDITARFIDVVLPISSLYQLPSSSLHIFYDIAGETIAFNRNASIFLNLRYYEAWHDEDVRKGNLWRAYASWYFSLAHEIAHNLVQPHNSEHEFYFSSISQRYLPGLSRLVSNALDRVE